VTRPESASPATGSKALHDAEHARLIEAALTMPDDDDRERS